MNIQKTKGQVSVRRRCGAGLRLFPWVWLAAGYCVTFAVLILYGRPYLDSDMSAEMILADLLNQEGGLLSQNWWYSTEIRVGYVQLFYRIGLAIFPHDWYAARMLGQMLMVLLLVVLCLYAGHGLKLKGNGVWAAAALVCPFGVWYLWYYCFSGAYLGHMLWLLLGFGAALHLVDAPGWRQRLGHGVLLAGSCLVSGLNGIKGIMVFYLPLLAAALVLCVMRWYQVPQDLPRRELRLAGLSVAALALAGVGYAVNSTVLAAAYQFNDYNTLEWKDLNLKDLLWQWGELLSLFGYPRDDLMRQEIPVFSGPGLLGAFGVLTAGVLVLSLFRLLGRWRELDERQRVVPVLFASICVVTGLIFVCAGEDMNASYWLLAIPFAFLTLQLEWETEPFPQKWMRTAAPVALCCCLVATSVGSVKQFFMQGLRVSPHLKTVCDWLVDNGYTQGYATFWNGDVLTEWSSGEIEMWVVGHISQLESVEPYEWLQKKSHVTPPEGEIFLLTSREELKWANLSALYEQSNVVYEDPEKEEPSETEETKATGMRDSEEEPSGMREKEPESYLVMVYESVEDMKAAVARARTQAE